MRRTVLKFCVMDRRGNQFSHVAMPMGAQVVHVGVQNGSVMLWAECNPDASSLSKSFEVYGTGTDVMCTPGLERKYVGSAQDYEMGFVWHVYEVAGRG